MKLTVAWDGSMSFSGTTPSGHQLTMDAYEEVGGENKGPRPTELLLNAVCGCTGIDIISILKKMRVTPSSFKMDVDSERAEEHPKKFTNIHIHYSFEGDELPEEKVAKAIRLSKDKYCSISHSLSATITASYSINGTKGSEQL